MCTVSIISLDAAASVHNRGGLRIVCNRDEIRTRPPAAPPKWRACGSRRAIWPMDLEAGGTWIGASDQGLALCLLNLNPDPPIDLRSIGKLRSRGLIIPRLLGSSSLRAVAGGLARMSLNRFAPFRLIGAQPGPDPVVLDARWDRASLSFAWHARIPLCFVSSGLGDALAAPRLDLFERLVVKPGPDQHRQDEFHRHTWPQRPEVSVLMSRDDARTVSIATLLLRPGAPVEMTYQPVPDALRTAPAIRALPRAVRV